MAILEMEGDMDGLASPTTIQGGKPAIERRKGIQLSKASSIAWNLSSVSASSRSGVDPATIPAPA